MGIDHEMNARLSGNFLHVHKLAGIIQIGKSVCTYSQDLQQHLLFCCLLYWAILQCGEGNWREGDRGEKLLPTLGQSPVYLGNACTLYRVYIFVYLHVCICVYHASYTVPGVWKVCQAAAGWGNQERLCSLCKGPSACRNAVQDPYLYFYEQFHLAIHIFLLCLTLLFLINRGNS